MGKQKNLQRLKLSSLSLLIGMAGCTNSTLCHLQWYPVPTQETVWTAQDTLTIDVPKDLQHLQTTHDCNWQLEAVGNAGFAYTQVNLLVGLATKDTVYWQKIQLHADSALVSDTRKETFGRTLWKQQGHLLQNENIGSHPIDSLRRLIILPLAETQHINDIGLCVQRQSARK